MGTGKGKEDGEERESRKRIEGRRGQTDQDSAELVSIGTAFK